MSFLKGLKPAERNHSYATQILLAMQLTGYRMYEGTVPAHVKAKRRAASKAARRARRLNRGR